MLELISIVFESSLTSSRVSHRSAGMISRSHFNKNKYTLPVFLFEPVSKLNEEACGDRTHPTSITQSIGELADTYQDY